MSTPLNVLFITADQWRGDCLSALGHSTVRTPNLDALAADGVLFARHYANAAPCGPSRACLHTGLYQHNHRSVTNGTPLDSRHGNWAIESAAIGYDPVLFGYTDTSADPRGFDDTDPRLRSYEGLLPGIRPVCPLDGEPVAWTDWLRAKGYSPPARVDRAYGYRNPGPDYEDGAEHPRPLAFPAEVDETAFLVERLMDFISSANTPFVAHLSLLRPHPPFVAPEPYNALYDPLTVPGFMRRSSPEEEGLQHPWLAWRLANGAFRAPTIEARLRRIKAVYYGLMTRVDAEIGRLINFLKSSGLYENTLIIFTSDHGEEMGDHWLLGKGGYFEGSYHIPLIIRDPRAQADARRGRVVQHFTESVDVAPTLLTAIGADAPPHCDGMDLSPFLAGAPTPATWRGEAHWEFDFRSVTDPGREDHLGLTSHQCTLNVVRGERYKYVHFTNLPPLFFDLENDPGELDNRIGDPSLQSEILSYAQKLLSWRMNHDEHGLTHIALTSEGPVTRLSPRY